MEHVWVGMAQAADEWMQTNTGAGYADTTLILSEGDIQKLQEGQVLFGVAS